MTLKEITYAQSKFDDATFLTWVHCCLGAKQMWRAVRKNLLLIKEEEKQVALFETAGYAMNFLQYLWALPQEWWRFPILNIDRNDPSFKPTYSESETQAWSLIAEYYEKKEVYFKDPLKRHFEVNRILRQDATSTGTPFNPHLVNRNN